MAINKALVYHNLDLTGEVSVTSSNFFSVVKYLLPIKRGSVNLNMFGNMGGKIVLKKNLSK